MDDEGEEKIGIFYILLGIALFIFAIKFIYTRREQSLMMNHNTIFKRDY